MSSSAPERREKKEQRQTKGDCRIVQVKSLIGRRRKVRDIVIVSVSLGWAEYRRQVGVEIPLELNRPVGAAVIVPVLRPNAALDSAML